jgi:putative FmdB family regulatory protein
VPIYEYQCKECGYIFEREHAIGEKVKYKCPQCSCSRTQKLVSQVGVIFKGTGFYRTDNRKNGSCGTTRTNVKTKEKKESTEVLPEIPTSASEN